MRCAIPALLIALAAGTAHAGRFGAGAAGFTRALRDPDTGLPVLAYGGPLPAPGASRAPVVAARRLLDRHLAELAPGARAADFALLVDREAHGTRTVAFAQHAAGLPVVGARISFRFRGDRLVAISSTAVPDLALPSPARSGRFVILPLRRRGAVEPRVAVAASRGTGFSRETVWLDAATGELLARRPLFRHASGTVRYDTPIRWPGGQRAAYPAAFADLTIRHKAAATDADGVVVWKGGGAASLTTSVTGPLVSVIDGGGAPASATLTLPAGGAVTWSAADAEFADAQITTFIHLGRVIAHARGIDPELAWLDQQVAATVNIDGFCNALSDGTGVYFFRGSAFCSNTGRLPDAIYHEYAHTLHQHALIDGEIDPALAEGIADYLAATITGDPGFARGFYLSDAPLRDLDPDDIEYVWPDDIDPSDPHQTGRIIGGALWDLRAGLIADLGAVEGARLADHLYYVALRHAVDIPSMYVEVLLADDDDGDLDNGTPHRCAIDAAFARHGLSDPDATGSIGSPEVSDLEVLVPAVAPTDGCPALEVAAMRLLWRVRGESDLSDPIEMAAEPGGFRAAIPDLAPGTAVEYIVEVERASGDVDLRPRNPADPYYQLFHGDTEPLYCTRFQGPPSDDGWVSGAYPPGSDDDWMWGEPWGTPGSGDPEKAFSGRTVYGTDLGGIDGDGFYPPGQVTWTDMPDIEVPDDAEQVRLQYRRWLVVEDGTFDVAAISANGGLAWQNAASSAGTISHVDREWRFHDVDVTDKVYQGRVKIRFEIAADEDIQLGGWNLDNVCLVTFRAPVEQAPDGGPGETEAFTDDGGCGCRVSPGSSWLPALVILAGQFRRRRRQVAGHRA